MHVGSDKLDYIAKTCTFLENLVFYVKRSQGKRILWLLRSVGAPLKTMSVNVPTLYLLNLLWMTVGKGH